MLFMKVNKKSWRRDLRQEKSMQIIKNKRLKILVKFNPIHLYLVCLKTSKKVNYSLMRRTKQF